MRCLSKLEMYSKIDFQGVGTFIPGVEFHEKNSHMVGFDGQDCGLVLP